MKQLKRGRVFSEMADYLKSEVHSRYGNNEFIVPFHSLMNSYKESRTDCRVKDVYLKLGGTLHYEYEVCYVIIMAMAKDITKKSLKEMPSVYDEECFIHNGCIDKDGMKKHSSLQLSTSSVTAHGRHWLLDFTFPSTRTCLCNVPKAFVRIRRLATLFASQPSQIRMVENGSALIICLSGFYITDFSHFNLMHLVLATYLLICYQLVYILSHFHAYVKLQKLSGLNCCDFWMLYTITQTQIGKVVQTPVCLLNNLPAT